MEEELVEPTRRRTPARLGAAAFAVCLAVSAFAQEAVPVVPGRNTAPLEVPGGESVEAPESKLPPAFPGTAVKPRPTTGEKLWKTEAPDWEARALLFRMRDSGDPEARARALEMLPLDEAKQSDFDRLFSAAQDPQLPVRQAAWNALDRCSEKDLFSYVIRTLAWGEADQVQILDAALPKLGPRLARLMTGTLETEIETLRHQRAAAYCLGRMGSEEAAPLLAKYAREGQDDLAETCAVALSMLRSPSALRDWEAMLTHPDITIRVIAVRALADLDTPPARRDLVETATGKREAGRQAEQEAVELVARWDDGDALPALISVLRENKPLNGVAARMLHDKTGQSFGTVPELWESWLQQGGQKRGQAEVINQPEE